MLARPNTILNNSLDACLQDFDGCCTRFEKPSEACYELGRARVRVWTDLRAASIACVWCLSSCSSRRLRSASAVDVGCGCEKAFVHRYLDIAGLDQVVVSSWRRWLTSVWSPQEAFFHAVRNKTISQSRGDPEELRRALALLELVMIFPEPIAPKYGELGTYTCVAGQKSKL